MTLKNTRRGFTHCCSLLTQWSKGFTLLEILVAVLIIGILGAIALPQYQRAVLKSRFAALMPIAKSMADSNEAYYLEHGEYAGNAEDLPVQGRRNYSDGTELEFGTTSEYSYVLATRDNDFPNNYVVYQKHSEQFPSEIHCEALADNDLAESVCKSFGGNESIGKTLTDGYETYVLFGTGNGVAPTGDDGGNDEPEEPACEGVSCDDDGNITECASGLTLNNGECVTCDIPNATSCSTTSYAPTACSDGYIVNGTACEPDPTYAQLQAVAAAKCPNSNSVCTIKNGVVYQCDKTYAKIDEATGECVLDTKVSGTISYERIYDADGNEIGYYRGSTKSGQLYSVDNKIPTADGGYKQVKHTCADFGAITKEGLCSNGYSYGSDSSYDSHGYATSSFNCSTSSTPTGECKYSSMITYDNSYSTNGQRSYVYKQCTTATDSNPESTCSGSYQPVQSRQYNEAGTAYKQVKCYDSNNNERNLNTNGTCPSGYPNVKSYDSATGQYTTCGTTAASVNWNTATCK